MNFNKATVFCLTALFLIAFESDGALPQECDSEPEYSLTDSVKTFCYTHRKKIIIATTLLVTSTITIALYHKAAIARLLHNPQTTTSANKTRPSPQPELQAIDCPYNDRVKIFNVKTLRQPNGTECHHQAMFNCMKFNEHLNKNNGSPEGYLSTINRDQFNAYVNDYLKNMAALKCIADSIAWFFGREIIKQNQTHDRKLQDHMSQFTEEKNVIYPWAGKEIASLFEHGKIPSVKEFQEAVTKANVNRWIIETCAYISPSLQPADIERITKKDIAEIASTIKNRLLTITSECQSDAFGHYDRIHAYQLDIAKQLPSKNDTSFAYSRKGLCTNILNYFSRQDQSGDPCALPNHQNTLRTLPAGSKHWLISHSGDNNHWYLIVIHNDNNQYNLHILDSLGTEHTATEEGIKTIIETFCTPDAKPAGDGL